MMISVDWCCVHRLPSGVIISIVLLPFCEGPFYKRQQNMIDATPFNLVALK